MFIVPRWWISWFHSLKNHHKQRKIRGEPIRVDHLVKSREYSFFPPHGNTQKYSVDYGRAISRIPILLRKSNAQSTSLLFQSAPKNALQFRSDDVSQHDDVIPGHKKSWPDWTVVFQRLIDVDLVYLNELRGLGTSCIEASHVLGSISSPSCGPDPFWIQVFIEYSTSFTGNGCIFSPVLVSRTCSVMSNWVNFSNDGGGGERVLWLALKALTENRPDLKWVTKYLLPSPRGSIWDCRYCVYSGDCDVSQSQILENVKVLLLSSASVESHSSISDNLAFLWQAFNSYF